MFKVGQIVELENQDGVIIQTEVIKVASGKITLANGIIIYKVDKPAIKIEIDIVLYEMTVEEYGKMLKCCYDILLDTEELPNVIEATLSGKKENIKKYLIEKYDVSKSEVETFIQHYSV